MKKKQQIKRNVTIVICLIGLAFLTFNDLGILKLISLYKETRLIQKEINELMITEIELNKELNLLRNDKAYIMKIAREEFFMAKPGEKIYRVEEQKFIK